MRTWIHGRRATRILIAAAVTALLGTAVAVASELFTDATLSSNVNAPTSVDAGEASAFDIKIWVTGNVQDQAGKGDVDIVTKYTMNSSGVITPSTNPGDIVRKTFNPGQYSGGGSICVGTSHPVGCQANPIVVNATLSVASGAPAGTDGTLKVDAIPVGGSGVNVGTTSEDTGYVEVSGPTDATEPDTSIESKPSDPTNSTSASFGFSGTDDQTAANALTFECSLDGAAYTSCTSPKSYTGLADGSHTFQVRAKDAANNLDSSPASHTWTVDTIAPAVGAPDLAAGSDSGSSSTDNLTNAATLTFDGTAEPGATVELYRGTTLAGTATATGGSWTISDTSAPEGTHSYTAKAIDAAGNDSTSSALSVTVDRTAPSVSAPDLDATSDTGTSNSDDLTKATSLSFAGTAEAGTSVELYRGTTLVDTVTATGGSWTISDTSAPEGTHSYTAKAIDAAGNDSTSSALSVTVDRSVTVSAPDLASTSDTGSSTTDNVTKAASLSFSGTAETGASVELYRGTTLVDTVTATGGNWTISDTSAPEGTLSYTAKAADAAGNTDTSSALSVTVDRTNPVLSSPSNVTVYSMTVPAVATWTNPTSDEGSVGCSPASGSSFPQGNTTVACSATDAAGNTGSVQFTVTVNLLAVTFGAPIDAPSTMNITKLGRVLPVKVRLTVNGTPVMDPSTLPIYIGAASGISCTATATVDEIEEYSAGSSNSGNLFRWDATGSQWIYNLDTSSFAMKANSCYRVNVYYGGTVAAGRASGGSLAGYFFVKTIK